MAESIVRFIGDLLFSTPATLETKDIFTQIAQYSIEEQTKAVIKAMMCENTGTHYLDSGGAYGRGWERSKSIIDKDWDKLPRTYLNYCNENDWYISKSLYHALKETLEYDIEMDKTFLEFAFSEEYAKESWSKTVDDWLNSLEAEFHGHWGNTYYFDTTIDRDIQYRTFIFEGNEYIAIQTHNGCDIRGGYSTVHIFRFSDDIDQFYVNLWDMSCRCKCGYIAFYTDDCGYHWYDNDGCGESIDEMIYNKKKDCFICPKCKKQINFY